jgi:hypothetical protein
MDGSSYLLRAVNGELNNMVPPTIEREVRHSLGEHETLLSFNSDMDAAAFEEWLENEGFEAFYSWVLKTTVPF